MSMDSTYRGDRLELTIYGQSHSPTIGVYIKGLPEGVAPDPEYTAKLMARRAPGNNAWSTPRREKDEVIFEREGDVLHGYIVNTNTKPKDYASIMNKPRPGHADYTGKIKYKDEAAQSGGGIFSGRMTAPLCIAGSIALNELGRSGIEVHAHLKKCAGVSDDSYYDHDVNDTSFKDVVFLSSVTTQKGEMYINRMTYNCTLKASLYAGCCTYVLLDNNTGDVYLFRFVIIGRIDSSSKKELLDLFDAVLSSMEYI